MVAPLVLLAGVATNVAIEYGYQRYTGQEVSNQKLVTAGALGFVPGLGMVKSVRKGVPVIRGLADEAVSPYYVGKYTDVAIAAYSSVNREAVQLVAGSIKALAINRVISYAYKPVATSVRSLTSSTQKSGTTTRIPGAKRLRSKTYLDLKSKYSGDTRRRTTYCKRHARYDFCKKYNIRK
jgi:hypothetical protein